jgi:hypothetical protein
VAAAAATTRTSPRSVGIDDRPAGTPCARISARRATPTLGRTRAPSFAQQSSRHLNRSGNVHLDAVALRRREESDRRRQTGTRTYLRAGPPMQASSAPRESGYPALPRRGAGASAHARRLCSPPAVTRVDRSGAPPPIARRRQLLGLCPCPDHPITACCCLLVVAGSQLKRAVTCPVACSHKPQTARLHYLFIYLIERGFVNRYRPNYEMFERVCRALPS